MESHAEKHGEKKIYIPPKFSRVEKTESADLPVVARSINLYIVMDNYTVPISENSV